MSTTRFRVERLDPLHPDSRGTVLSMARSFRLIYSNDLAWQETYTCPACSAAYPAENPPPVCTNKKCRFPAPLVDFWTIPRILTEFYVKMSREGTDPVCFVAIDNETGNVVGSCQGMLLTPNQLAEDLGLTKHLDMAHCLWQNFPERKRVAYQSEINILPSFQGKNWNEAMGPKPHLARQLFLARHRHFAELDPKGVAVLRTQREPKATSYKWMIDGPMGYQIVGEYQKTAHPDQRDRVIAAQTIQVGLDHYDGRE